MPRAKSMFGPSDRALEFGRQYATVFEAWAEFFAASAKLTAANVRLGEMAQDAAKDWDKWVQATANGPWSWMNPDAMRQMLGASAKRTE